MVVILVFLGLVWGVVVRVVWVVIVQVWLCLSFVFDT